MTAEVRGSLYLAAGSFLDLTARELTAVAEGLEGCDGIGLRLSGEHRIDDVSHAHEIRDRLSAVGQRVFDAEVVRVSAPFEHESVADLLRCAAAVGARHVLAVADLEREALDASIDSFGKLDRLAREAGLSVAVEYMAWTVPWDVDSALKVHASTGCRIVVDVLHHTRLGLMPSDLERLCRADAVAWVQICDAPTVLEATSLVMEARHERLIPGGGGLPLCDYMAVIPPRVDVSIEVQSDRLRDVEPRERAQQLLDATRALRL